MEVKINGQKLVRSPFSFLVKVRELNIIGKLDFPGEMPPSSAGIAVNSKGVIAVADLDGLYILVFDDTGMFATWLSWTHRCKFEELMTSHSWTMTRFWW